MTRVNKRILLSLIFCLAASGAIAEETTPISAEPVDLVEPVDLGDLAAATNAPEGSLDGVKESNVSLSRDPGSAVTRSFTIEGEDRISISFDRPRISLDLDPRQAPGPGWQDSWDKLDVYPAITGRTALAPLNYLGQPWLGEFAQGDVVVFSPDAGLTSKG